MSTKNSTFFKILVAIDGSEKSIRAAEYAIDIAINQKANVQLIAVTVIETFKTQSINVCSRTYLWIRRS